MTLKNPFSKKFIQLSIKLLGPRGLKWIFIGLVASVGIALVELLVSIVIQLLLISFGFLSNSQIIGYLRVLPQPLPIYLVTSLLCFTAVIRFIVQLTSTQTGVFVKDLVNYRLKQNGVAQMLFSESQDFRRASAVNFNIGEVFVKSSEFTFNAILFLSMSVQSLFLFAIMFILAWKESIVAFFGILVIGFCVLSVNKKVSKFAKLIPKEQKILNEGIEKIARNYIFIKLMKKRQEEYNGISNALTEYSSKSIRANFFSNFTAQMGPFLGILLLVCIILVSQGLWHSKPLVLISFIYLLARFVQSLSILTGYFGNCTIFLPQFLLGLESVANESFVSNCIDRDYKVTYTGKKSLRKKTSNHSLLKQLNPEPLRSPEINFENMSFSYGESKEIFSNINIKIDAGTQVGIIGPSGTGKSTLLMLLTGILKPTKGIITIDHIPAHEYVSLEEIRIGYVGAEPFLIQGSLKDNLCYGLSRPVSHEEILSVLRMVSLDQLVEEKGLNYKIAEDQSGVSAGQKQRLCLARAILNKPSLLILDEATANLDEGNERQVAEILNSLKGQCTTIIVSHRPGILVYVNKIIEMKDFIH